MHNLSLYSFILIIWYLKTTLNLLPSRETIQRLVLFWSKRDVKVDVLQAHAQPELRMEIHRTKQVPWTKFILQFRKFER